jgi:hypothetical protein
MHGVYLVAAELAARGLIVSPTSRSAAGADLLVTDERCQTAFSVQVKTNAKPSSFWLVGHKAATLASKSHVYVLVNIHPKTGEHEFYIVPSTALSKKVVVEERPNSVWHAFFKRDALRYRDKWNLLGAPRKSSD